MTFFPAQPVMLETEDWSEFKSVALVQKQLRLNYLEYVDRYDIRAADTERFRIVLKKGTADANDFEANYKAASNARYDIRTVLVTQEGMPTIDTLGATAPVGATMVAGLGSDGKLRSFMIDAETGHMVVDATGHMAVTDDPFTTYKTTSLEFTVPPTDPVPPAEGGPWHLVCAVTAEDKKTMHVIWGAM